MIKFVEFLKQRPKYSKEVEELEKKFKPSHLQFVLDLDKLLKEQNINPEDCARIEIELLDYIPEVRQP